MKRITFQLFYFTLLMLFFHSQLNAIPPYSAKVGAKKEVVHKKMSWKKRISLWLVKKKIVKSTPRRKARITLMNGAKINGRIIKATKDSIYIKRPLIHISRKSLKKYEQGDLLVLPVQSAIKKIKLIPIAKLRGFLIIFGLGVLFSLLITIPNLGTTNPDGLSNLDIALIFSVIGTVGTFILGGLFSLIVGIIHPDIPFLINGDSAAFDLELLKSLLRLK